ncbi:MAG: hypothetical protein EBS59_09550 [Verrucomicrobia bacterium]|nr:hypothetical protein [Verrucomicrobiota bacterium]
MAGICFDMRIFDRLAKNTNVKNEMAGLMDYQTKLRRTRAGLFLHYFLLLRFLHTFLLLGGVVQEQTNRKAHKAHKEHKAHKAHKINHKEHKKNKEHKVVRRR